MYIIIKWWTICSSLNHLHYHKFPFPGLLAWIKWNGRERNEKTMIWFREFLWEMYKKKSTSFFYLLSTPAPKQQSYPYQYQHTCSWHQHSHSCLHPLLSSYPTPPTKYRSASRWYISMDDICYHKEMNIMFLTQSSCLIINSSFLIF